MLMRIRHDLCAARADYTAVRLRTRIPLRARTLRVHNYGPRARRTIPCRPTYRNVRPRGRLPLPCQAWPGRAEHSRRARSHSPRRRTWYIIHDSARSFALASGCWHPRPLSLRSPRVCRLPAPNLCCRTGGAAFNLPPKKLTLLFLYLFFFLSFSSYASHVSPVHFHFPTRLGLSVRHCS